MAKPRSPFSVLFVGVTLLWMLAALYMTFIYAPEEATMGPVQRIFYFHVGSAWTAFLAYFLVFVGSVGYLVTRSARADIFAHSAAEVGFVFCSLVLTTGPLWAKPVWGIWWPWDARITLTFVLWLLFVSYLVLRDYFGESDRSAALGAVVGIVGFIVVPLDYFAIRWWRTHHPSPVVLAGEGAGGLVEPVREHIFAITRRWMDPDGDGDPSDGIDGWRLDVAADINANFWRDWRKLVKSINPDAYIVAELWEESRAWLDGTTFDAVMNYPFARSAQRFFVNKKKAIKPSRLAKELQDQLAWYPPQVNYVIQNLFNSHDTDRVASMFMNPDLEFGSGCRPCRRDWFRVPDRSAFESSKVPKDEQWSRQVRV